MTDADNLDKYISILKEQFPSYTYINSLTDECLESTLSASDCDYAIIVKNIPRYRFAEFSSFVDEHILSDLIEKDESLPCVIKFQKEDAIADISFSLGLTIPYVQEFPNGWYLKGEYLCAAENYDYAMAA